MPDISQFKVSLSLIALCASSLVFFSAWIGLLRGATNILRGDGGNRVLFKRIRIHGNFVENAPLIALALLAAEGLGLGATWLWLAVASFIVGRVYHFIRYDEKDRGVGMFLTTAPGLGLGLFVLTRLWG